MFFEFSHAFSVDFGRRRKTQLPDGITIEELDIEDDIKPEEPEQRVGFRRNEEA